jgi:hypothetical protein
MQQYFDVKEFDNKPIKNTLSTWFSYLSDTVNMEMMLKVSANFAIQ